MTFPTAPMRDRVYLVGVERADRPDDWPIEESMAELRQLAVTAGAEVVGSMTQKLRTPHPKHFIGSGKVAELHEIKVEHQISLFIFDEELSPSQQNNLERDLNARVMDRHGLILAIFAQRARTHEGRLQVELAQYEYLLPRLAGQWTHLERQRGGIDVRGGPGETQLEVDRRLVRRRISELKKELERVRHHRAQYRARRARNGVPVVALVGYTNAGKSTVMNALANAGVQAENKLFATLDPTTRRVRLPSGREVLLSDTVGFIQKLPPTLVAAFRATLEELESADLLIHVVDVTHPAGPDQAQSVDETLADLGLAEKPVVTALNKIDRLATHVSADGSLAVAPTARVELDETAEVYPNAVPISATMAWGLNDLLGCVDGVLRDEMVDITVHLPYSQGKLAALFRLRGSVDEERYDAGGIRMRGKVPVALEPMFTPFAPPGGDGHGRSRTNRRNGG